MDSNFTIDVSANLEELPQDYNPHFPATIITPWEHKREDHRYDIPGHIQAFCDAHQFVWTVPENGDKTRPTTIWTIPAIVGSQDNEMRYGPLEVKRWQASQLQGGGHRFVELWNTSQVTQIRQFHEPQNTYSILMNFTDPTDPVFFPPSSSWNTITVGGIRFENARTYINNEIIIQRPASYDHPGIIYDEKYIKAMEDGNDYLKVIHRATGVAKYVRLYGEEEIAPPASGMDDMPDANNDISF